MTETKCPTEIRSSNRKRAIRKVHGTKEWKVARGAFLKDHPWCREHQKYGLRVPATTPHHPHMASTRDGLYLDLSGCQPYCTRCHFALHHGMNLCLRCATRGETRYKRWDQEVCRTCFGDLHPDIVLAREQRARDRKETQKRIRQESQEKFRMNRAKEIIKIQLYACNRPRRTINQETATVFVWIKNSGKNPLTVKRRTLERMTEEWVRKWRS